MNFDFAALLVAAAPPAGGAEIGQIVIAIAFAIRICPIAAPPAGSPAAVGRSEARALTVAAAEKVIAPINVTPFHGT